MGLLTWLAAKLSRSQVVEPVALVETPSLYYQHTRIGGSLTPDDVSNILRTADTGYMWRLCDLANESRQKDCHLQSILGTREMETAGRRHLVTPASDSAADRKIADWTTEWLGNFGTSAPKVDGETPRDLRHLISHLSGGNYFGYAVAETLFERDGQYVIPIGSVPIAPRRFVFDIQSGGFRFWDVQGTVSYPGTDLMAEFPGRFINFHPRVNGDFESREGLARLLVWAALFRNWAEADWMKLAEIAWKPWRTGTYVTGRGADKTRSPAAKEDKAILLSALQGLTSNGVAVIPDTCTLKVEWPSKGTGSANHAALCEFLAKEMSKATLGQTMTTDDGSSKAQAVVHNEVRHDIGDSDAYGTAAVIRRDMIAPAVRLNFGRTAAIPGFALLAEKNVDLVKLATATLYFFKAGLPMPATWAREQAGIPEPKIGEELVGGGIRVKPGTEPKPPPPPPAAANDDEPAQDEEAA